MLLNEKSAIVTITGNGFGEELQKVVLQSAHNRRWHLGFNHKATSLAVIKGRAPHKGALPRHGKFFDPKRCDFNFYAGEHQKEHREFEFSGLDSLIEEASNAKKQQHSTKAANISDNEIGPNKQTEFGHKYDTATASDRKISKAHKQALLQQRALKQHKKRYHLKKKIRGNFGPLRPQTM